MNKIKREDNIIVMKGKDRGRQGQVRKVIPPGKKSDKYGAPKAGRLIVTGVNMVKRHQAPRGAQQPGGIIEREAPIPWANVAIVCPECTKPARVGFRTINERKIRYCKHCDGQID
jgi:large subunit ribosomal protein L24